MGKAFDWEEAPSLHMVTKADLERLKIDVVDELHEIRRRHTEMLSEEIERAVAEIVKQMQANG